ncbi:hypothetical protein AWZ03_012072 [Drosophila navojoa]|uniref:Uncharacterized protein n=1 Tax=Drosophila navojoa TaxID=7232 RepID=A0A484AYC6_DRONA|nr:hypothetical protein AWZ03_012072 [Drosophila navojoa]
MRCLKSFVFITLMAVVAAQTPSLSVRAPLLRKPLIKLAVQPAIVNQPVAVAAVEEDPAGVLPAVAARPILPLVNPQYWGQFGAQNYGPYNPYGFNPYWGGYGQVRPRRFGSRFWAPRVVVAASTVAPAADADKAPEDVANADIEVVEAAPHIN